MIGGPYKYFGHGPPIAETQHYLAFCQTLHRMRGSIEEPLPSEYLDLKRVQPPPPPPDIPRSRSNNLPWDHGMTRFCNLCFCGNSIAPLPAGGSPAVRPRRALSGVPRCTPRGTRCRDRTWHRAPKDERVPSGLGMFLRENQRGTKPREVPGFETNLGCESE